MKAYTVTEDQLESLGALQFSTALCFSFASSFLTFWAGVKENIAFSGGVSADALGRWNGLATGALIASIVLALLGIMQFFKGRTTIGKIKKDTRHE